MASNRNALCLLATLVLVACLCGPAASQPVASTPPAGNTSSMASPSPSVNATEIARQVTYPIQAVYNVTRVVLNGTAEAAKQLYNTTEEVFISGRESAGSAITGIGEAIGNVVRGRL